METFRGTSEEFNRELVEDYDLIDLEDEGLSMCSFFIWRSYDHFRQKVRTDSVDHVGGCVVLEEEV